MVVFTIHHRLAGGTGAPGSTLALAERARAEGMSVRVFSHADLPGWIRGTLAHVVFPVVLLFKLRSSAIPRGSIVDASSGDLWLSLGTLRRAGIKSIFRSHGLEHLLHNAEKRKFRSTGRYPSWKYRFFWGGLNLCLVARTMRRSDARTFLSRVEYRYARRYLRIPHANNWVFPNGISDVFFTKREDPGRAAIRSDIAFIGSYLPNKGIDVVEAIVPDILRSNPDSRIHLIGVKKEPEDIRSRWPEDLHPRIVIVPDFKNDELPALLRDCGILLFPSRVEGFGKALVEGMACGLAPVSSNVSGPRDILRDYDSRFICRPGDVDGFARALGLMVRDGETRERLRRLAREISGRFRWGKIYEGRRLVYESIGKSR